MTIQIVDPVVTVSAQAQCWAGASVNQSRNNKKEKTHDKTS